MLHKLRETATDEYSDVIHYGSREIDFTRYVGIGDYTIRTMASPHDGSLYWIRWGRDGGVISRVAAVDHRWHEANAQDVFSLGMRSFWAPTFHVPSNSFYFVSDENNEETFNIYRLGLDMRQVTRMTDVGYTMGYTFAPQSNTLLFLGRPEKLGQTTSLLELSLDTPDAVTELYTDDSQFRIYPYLNPVIDDANERIAFVLKQDNRRSRKNLAIYVRSTGKITIVTDAAIERNFLQPLGWRNDRLWLLSDEGSEKQSLYAFDATSGHLSLVEANPFQAADGVFDPVTQRVLVEFRDGTHGVLTLLDAVTGDVKARQACGQYDFWWSMCHPLGAGEFSVSTKMRDERDVLVCRLDFNAEQDDKILTVDFEPSVNRRQAAPCHMEQMSYPTFDLDHSNRARPIESIMFWPRTIPRDPQQRAAIVWAHGGPSGRTTKSWHANIQLFTALGYIVLGANPRGSAGQGKQFEDLNNHDWGGGDYWDYEHGLRYLMHHLEIPIKRIGMAGFSFGGYMTNWAVTRPNGLFGFGISLAGVSDLARSIDESVVATNTISEMGDFDENAGPYHARSPIHWAEYMDVPLLLIHGSQDHRTSTNQSRIFYKKLKTLQKDVELVEIAGEGHGFRALKSQRESFQHQANFLRRVAPVDIPHDAKP